MSSLIWTNNAVTGEPFIAEEWHVPYDQDGDGQIEDHWFNVAYVPLQEPDGLISGLVAVCSEVTDTCRTVYTECSS